MKSESIAHLVSGSAHVYWIFDLEGEVHSIWVLWSSNFQECKGNVFFESRPGQAIIFYRDKKKIKNFYQGLSQPLFTSHWKFVGGGLTTPIMKGFSCSANGTTMMRPNAWVQLVG